LVNLGQREEVCVGRAFFGTFCVLFIYPFFVFLLTPTGHTRRQITTVYGSKRAFPRNVIAFGGYNDKNMFAAKTPQKHNFGEPEEAF